MNFLTNVAVNLHDVKERLLDAETPEQRKKIKTELDNLWKNICHYKRDLEAVNCSGVHSEETLKEAMKSLSKVTGANNLRDSIINNEIEKPKENLKRIKEISRKFFNFLEECGKGAGYALRH